MLRDAAVRLVAGGLLGLAICIGALFVLPVVLFGRREYLGHIGSASSALLNALTGGPPKVTFSAYSALLAERGEPLGALRVRFVDSLPLNDPGHCAGALASHRALPAGLGLGPQPPT